MIDGMVPNSDDMAPVGHEIRKPKRVGLPLPWLGFRLVGWFSSHLLFPSSRFHGGATAPATLEGWEDQGGTGVGATGV